MTTEEIGGWMNICTRNFIKFPHKAFVFSSYPMIIERESPLSNVYFIIFLTIKNYVLALDLLKNLLKIEPYSISELCKLGL